MMVVDRNMYEQVKVIFNVNFKTLSSLIKVHLLVYELYKNSLFCGICTV